MRMFADLLALVLLLLSPWAVIVGFVLAVIEPNGFTGLLIALGGMLVFGGSLEHFTAED